MQRLAPQPWMTSAAARRVMAALEAARPNSARFVGGCVRNALLGEPIADIDIATQLTPDKVDALADRFERVRDVVGADRKKPRFNAVLSFTTNSIAEAQVLVQKVLDKMTKRWMLDEVVTHSGKPSEVYYLVRLRKAVSRDDLLTAIRARAGDRIGSAQVELGEAAVLEQEAV